MKYFFLVLAFCCLHFFAAGQTYNYVNGSLDVTIRAFNPCGGPTSDNGYLEITPNAAAGAQVRLIFLDGPGLIDDFGVDINVGSTYTFNASNTLPDGTYDLILLDPVSGATINTFINPSFPPIILTAAREVRLSGYQRQNAS